MTGTKLALQNPACVLKNEQGVVMIATLLVLVLLTIVGIASLNLSNTEIQIAGHQVAYQQNFYRTEGAIVEAVALLDGESDPKADPPSWLEPNLDAITDEDIKNDIFWENGSNFRTLFKTISNPLCQFTSVIFFIVKKGSL